MKMQTECVLPSAVLDQMVWIKNSV